MQPYRNGDHAAGHFLRIVQTLNRETKHRHLPVLAVAIPQAAHLYEPRLLSSAAEAMGVETFGIRAMGIALSQPWLKDGDEIATIPYHLAPKPRAPHEAHLSTCVTLAQCTDTRRELGALMGNLYQRVRDDIVCRFAPFFRADGEAADLPRIEVQESPQSPEAALRMAIEAALRKMHGPPDGLSFSGETGSTAMHYEPQSAAGDYREHCSTMRTKRAARPRGASRVGNRACTTSSPNPVQLCLTAGTPSAKRGTRR